MERHMTSHATNGLVARTVAVELGADPVLFGGDDGFIFTHPSGSLAGAGTALRIPLPRGGPDAIAAAVARSLGSIERVDDVRAPGCGPVAFGALPFAPGAPAELVVPRVLVGRGEDGTRWVTTVTSPADPADPEDPNTWVANVGADRDRGGRDGRVVGHDELPGAFEVVTNMAPGEWCQRIEKACARLRAGELRKVVLAREVDIRADTAISRRAVLERLRDAYPGCMLFAVDNFVGASPELLVARHGDRVRSHPLAGTAPRSADLEADALLAAELRSSDKNREEHRITIDMVHEALLPYCSYLDEEAEPSIVPMANVMHLGTMVEGQLSSPAPSVLELALTLHPTPAVGGWPTDRALAVIDELEGIDRGRYAGPVGWVDADGNGEWAVGIRSAELGADGLTARVFAGVGVVADSDPLSELAETRAKFQAMLSAIIRP